MSIDEGIIKYRQKNFIQTEELLTIEYHNLEAWREKLYRLALIGEYPTEKVGYGNLSQFYDYSQYFQSKNPQFLITGSQTGGLPKLTGEHYTRILDYDLESFELQAMGPIQASSESLTHAALYQANPEIKAVFHIHNLKIWEELLKSEETRTPDVAYGTSEIAIVAKTIGEKSSTGIFAMAGHEEGVIAYAPDCDSAGELLLKAYQEFIG